MHVILAQHSDVTRWLWTAWTDTRRCDPAGVTGPDELVAHLGSSPLKPTVKVPQPVHARSSPAAPSPNMTSRRHVKCQDFSARRPIGPSSRPRHVRNGASASLAASPGRVSRSAVLLELPAKRPRYSPRASWVLKNTPATHHRNPLSPLLSSLCLPSLFLILIPFSFPTSFPSHHTTGRVAPTQTPFSKQKTTHYHG